MTPEQDQPAPSGDGPVNTHPAASQSDVPAIVPRDADLPEDGRMDVVPDAVQLDLDALMAGAELAGTNTDAWSASTARRAIEELLSRRGEFTSDDLYELLPAVDHPNRVGGWFLGAARAGRIEAVGARRSSRPERHGSLVRVWRGTPAALAESEVDSP